MPCGDGLVMSGNVLAPVMPRAICPGAAISAHRHTGRANPDRNKVYAWRHCRFRRRPPKIRFRSSKPSSRRHPYFNPYSRKPGQVTAFSLAQPVKCKRRMMRRMFPDRARLNTGQDQSVTLCSGHKNTFFCFFLWLSIFIYEKIIAITNTRSKRVSG